MPRKRTHARSGRPAADPIYEKMSVSARAMITPNVAEKLIQLSETFGISNPPRGMIPSDIVRLGMYRLLAAHGLVDERIAEDPSWKTLKEKGLV